ncbi:MAG TPA: asparagine synthase C-terminal domain-containing protein, partial [Chloroflexota bacterium]|nr:asparagine synthase C-terminal domain-containing protein [Chloroflexota bacterium]
IKPSQWDQVFAQLERVGRRSSPTARPGDRMHKVAQLLYAQSPEDAYARIMSYWLDPASSVVGGQEPLTLLRHPAHWPHLAGFVDQLQYVDTLTYLPDDILTKIDRATMAVSLEARVPFLDHEVVEFAWRLPPAYKFRDGQGKWILRQVLSRYLPNHLQERPKMGFGVPIGQWLRGPLREWAESLLATDRIRAEGFLAPDAVRGKWEEHQTGRRNLDHQLWAVLMFQAWLETNRSPTTSVAH